MGPGWFRRSSPSCRNKQGLRWPDEQVEPFRRERRPLSMSLSSKSELFVPFVSGYASKGPRMKTSYALFVSFLTRFEADDSKTTKRPSPEMRLLRSRFLSPLACLPCE